MGNNENRPTASELADIGLTYGKKILDNPDLMRKIEEVEGGILLACKEAEQVLFWAKGQRLITQDLSALATVRILALYTKALVLYNSIDMNRKTLPCNGMSLMLTEGMMCTAPWEPSPDLGYTKEQMMAALEEECGMPLKLKLHLAARANIPENNESHDIDVSAVVRFKEMTARPN